MHDLYIQHAPLALQTRTYILHNQPYKTLVSQPPILQDKFPPLAFCSPLQYYFSLSRDPHCHSRHYRPHYHVGQISCTSHDIN